MAKNTILIVDDEPNNREGLRRALQRTYDVCLASDAKMALQALQEQAFDVMLSDIRMPGKSGIELLAEVHEKYPQTSCILLTAYGDIETAVDAMRKGAEDFLTKPIDLDRLDQILSRIFKHRKTIEENRALTKRNNELERALKDRDTVEGIIGTSAPMQNLYRLIHLSAPSTANVLITGPSGSGKELVAQAIHKLSNRAKGPFVAVNCAALTSSLLESELFGYEKGAFTGAEETHQGRFERAEHGTLFLDEIGEIDLTTQVKLLRVLQEHTFERVGGTQTIKADFRLVAATNKDLEALVREGKFREDLYYRLNVINLQVPPLKERKEDIPAIAQAFIKEIAVRDGKTINGITQNALALLQNYDWPGNVRELRNIVERMVVLTPNTTLNESDVPLNSATTAPNTLPHPTTLADTEKDQILNALKKHNNNKTRAAEELGINRKTLHRKLQSYGIEQ